MCPVLRRDDDAQDERVVEHGEPLLLVKNTTNTPVTEHFGFGLGCIGLGWVERVGGWLTVGDAR